MKLVIAVVEDDDASVLTDVLAQAGIRATKLASTGGFLLQGNTTLLIGTDDARVGEVMGIVKKTCRRRKKMLSHASSDIPTGINIPIEVESGGAITFVVRVDQFHKL
ncbi:MAG: cyclic-di-AMP receptor [Firmicutes bacterium]|nr:cyclic-di-AMP receptor [Bacillota bacterium]